MGITITSQNITLKFLGGQNCDTEYTFCTDQKIIKIGRSNDCEIKFDDNSLSRYQCCIQYDNKWVLRDGYLKPSTNGSWLFAEEEFTIVNGTAFKAGQTLFSCDVADKQF